MLDDLERRLCDTIAARADELHTQLAEHVSIPTGRGHRPGLEQYRTLIIERLLALGASVDVRDGVPRPDWVELPGGGDDEGPPQPIVVATRQGAPSPRVILAGHLDTVHDPHGEFQTLQPAENGCVTGPGAVDMKGGIIVGLTALEAMNACDVDLSWTFVLNGDEETGSFQSLDVLRDVARGHDVGIAVEPALADGALAVARMGSGQFKVEAFGRSAHVGREFERGVSAVTALAHVLTRVADLADPAAGCIINVGPLVGGDVTNAVPDYAAAWGNMRYADEAAGERLRAGLAALASETEPRIVIHQTFNRPFKPLTDDVRRLAEAAREAAQDLGQQLPFAETGGVCDGNLLQSVGVPTLDTLGVRGGNLHRLDEFVEVASLVERGQLLAVLLSRLARG
jgi:glutamate carboxypeptidase